MIGKAITRTRYPVLVAGIALVLLGVALRPSSGQALRLGSSQAQAGADSNIDPTDKWAWSTGAGWIDFNPTHGGVTVYNDHLEGYAWAENVGWIRLGTHTDGGAHTYANTTQDNYGVNNDGSGNLSGYAWSTNAGWIDFSPTYGGVSIDPTTGSFTGYAWSENVGWIHFKPDTYNVVVTDGSIDPTDKYAWSANAGWIDFDPTHGGVTVYNNHLEGYAWAENVGWIRLGTHTGGGAHTYANTTQDNYGVNNDGSGNLSGYAWSTNAGWIDFSPTYGGVSIDPTTGSLGGYVWSENVGWIHFKPDTYNVAVNLADLSLAKSIVPSTATPGQTITYTLIFSNAGNGTATGVVITDIIPVSVTNTSVVSSGVVITDIGAAPGYVWDVVDLAPSAGGVITITGVLSDPLTVGVFTNTAAITTTAIDSDASNNRRSAEITVFVAPEITVDPLSLVFGDQDVDAGPTVSQTVTITNDGSADLHISGVSLTGTNAAEFTITGDTGETTLTPGATRAVQVSFDPSSVGAKSANLSIQSDDADESTTNVVLSGTGTSAVITYTLTVSKDGTGSGTVGSTPAGINCGTACQAGFTDGTVVTLTTVVGGGSTFAGWAGEGCSGTGVCQVTMDADRHVTATFNLAAGQPGYGSIPAPGSSINVGTASVGSTVSATLTISETGDMTLVVTPTLSGADAADFGVTPSTLIILDDGAAQDLIISCTPSFTGTLVGTLVRTLAATLTVAHNAPGSPAVYPLSCTGEALHYYIYLPLVLRQSP